MEAPQPGPTWSTTLNAITAPLSCPECQHWHSRRSRRLPQTEYLGYRPAAGRPGARDRLVPHGLLRCGVGELRRLTTDNGWRKKPASSSSPRTIGSGHSASLRTRRLRPRIRPPAITACRISRLCSPGCATTSPRSAVIRGTSQSPARPLAEIQLASISSPRQCGTVSPGDHRERHTNDSMAITE